MIVRHRPQSSAQSSATCARVDAGVVLGDVVLVEERDRVTHVLLVQLDDLELREQQLRQRHRLALRGEPALERDLVTHPERADEHVDLPVVRVSKKSSRPFAFIALNAVCGS